MEYELKHYYRVKYALVCARQNFLKEPPKDDFKREGLSVVRKNAYLNLMILTQCIPFCFGKISK